MNEKESLRVRRTAAGLVVVDIQERLLPVIWEKERVVQNSVRLIRSAAVMGVPVFATEQYRKGLGQTVREVAGAAERFAPREKLAFSACGADGFVEALREQHVADAILCGIEAHVCVCQTALDLLAENFRVYAVADAMSSRAAENHRLGLERMRDAGATVVSTEMIIFELLGKAGSEEFKQILGFIK